AVRFRSGSAGSTRHSRGASGSGCNHARRRPVRRRGRDRGGLPHQPGELRGEQWHGQDHAGISGCIPGSFGKLSRHPVRREQHRGKARGLQDRVRPLPHGSSGRDSDAQPVLRQQGPAFGWHHLRGVGLSRGGKRFLSAS
ncbi:unnamed protein product, partial [Ectocarpus fasciculatus]